MTRKLIIALALLIALGGCAPGAPPTQPPAAQPPAQTPPPVEVATEEPPAHHGNANARNNLDWQGVYQGVVPAASGMGIRVQVSLRYDDTLGGVFSLTHEHLDGDMALPEIADGSWEEWVSRVGFESGTFEWDETGNVIRLDVNDWPPYFFVGEGRIYQMDMSGQRITGELADNYMLSRVMPGPTPVAPTADKKPGSVELPGFSV